MVLGTGGGGWLQDKKWTN